ncbi:uncharacterized protein LOC128550511 [Mercenaria mercenaria]|uniref:uncharacterized protein LOC128550511 n=1 Tax=Mercenaria mercenaria TaxID=6596 RepID=UPI00234F8382|nr:uncharacterized protein LOC128550511 [Mercenaria mercenaria]
MPVNVYFIFFIFFLNIDIDIVEFCSLIKCKLTYTDYYICVLDIADLITSYVKSLNQDSPIQCEDAYAQASAQRNERVLHKVIKEFKTDMEKSRNLKSKTHLQDMFLRQFEQTLTKYRADSLPYRQEEYEGRATDEMKKHVDMLNAELSQACQKVGKEKLSKMYDEMLEKNSPRHLTSDGYRHYEEDMNKLKEVFFEEMKDYDKDELYICLEAFKKSKNDDKMTLYRAETGRYGSSQYNAIHDKINKKMNEKFERVLQNEIQKRNKLLEEELKILRAKYKDLSKSVESRSWCSVM